MPRGDDRARKLAIRYGTGKLWDDLFKVFFWEDNYRHMLTNYKLHLFHYEWIRPGEYFNARVSQLNRTPELWENALALRDHFKSKPPKDQLTEKLDSFDYDVIKNLPSTWAEQNRTMSSAVSPWNGTYSFDNATSLREILDCMMPNHP